MSWLSNTVGGWLGLDKLLIDYNTFDIKDYEPEAFFGDYTGYSKKLKTIFSNPALLKVITLQCDLFSLGKPYVYRNGKSIEKDPALDRLNNPNPMQTSSQFMWDYMFWNMLGVDYVYVDSDLADDDTNKMYVLENSKIEWPEGWKEGSDKLVFSKKAEADYKKKQIRYIYNDGSSIQIPLSKIICVTDLTNGLGDWYSGNSRIDALYKVISNSEASLDAKNINTRYTGKFIVSGQADPKDINKIPLGDDEKSDIETKMNGRKKVHAMKSMIEIRRFVDQLKNLGLDESYLADYFVIGNMFNIPRDILDAALRGSTFENQEKAVMRHVAYTLQPKADELTTALGNRWGYKRKEIVISWDHLPFMQVFEKERADTEQVKITTFANLLNIGVSLEEANKYLDLEFTTGERTNQNTNEAGTTGGNQTTNQQSQA